METPSENQPAENFNKLDLSALQNFQFGTQWSSTDNQASKDGSARARDERGGDQGAQRRDRRQGRRPQGFQEGAGEQAPRDFRPSHDGGQPRREFRERREGPGGFSGRPPRGEGGPRGGGRFERAPERPAGPPQPYISPYFEVTFYPDDIGFAALIKAMRSSGRTYELFQIASLLLEKNDRFVAVIRRTNSQEPAPEEGKPAAEGGAERRPLFVSVPDGVPFETEDAAVRHVLSKHLASFFDTEETEVEAPKGSFPFVHKCPRSGELIGPPNYHRYNQLLAQQHAEKAPDMPLEVYKARLEAVREPEAIASWVEKMKKATKYIAKIEVEGVKAQFTSREDAIVFLTTRLRDKVVRESTQLRFPGKSFEFLQHGEIRRAVEGALMRQRRFPLDTANALRGRLRREGLFLFKLPGKTITFVSAIKPRARRVGQVFSATIDPILTIIDNKPFGKMADFERKILGLEAAPVATAEAPAPAAEYTDEQKEVLVKALRDLRWLVHEGYVVEFADGRLYALPAASSEAKAQAAIEEVGGPSHGHGASPAAEGGADEVEPG